jgi:CMP/dCMP kinase
VNERRRLVVSIDGPGSSGKSTVGAVAATRLGYRFCDTGVLYRGLTLLAVRQGVDPDDPAAILGLVAQLNLTTDGHDRYVRLVVGGADLTAELHTEAVERLVSRVSRHAQIRAALLPVQRRLAAGGGIVMAGRDIGTVVLPDADVKIYLEVTVEERARRRALQRGEADDESARRRIEDDLRRRDGIDSSREARSSSKQTATRSNRPSSRSSASSARRVGDRNPSHRPVRRFPVPAGVVGRCPRPRLGSGERSQVGSADRRRQPPVQRRPAHRRRLADARPWPADAHPGQGSAVRWAGRCLPAQPGSDARARRWQRRRRFPRGPCGARARRSAVHLSRRHAQLHRRAGQPETWRGNAGHPIRRTGPACRHLRDGPFPRPRPAFSAPRCPDHGACGQTFIDRAKARRAALEEATDEIMRAIAAQLEPRHRGRYGGNEPL